jgi:hypothetical protein
MILQLTTPKRQLPTCLISGAAHGAPPDIHRHDQETHRGSEATESSEVTARHGATGTRSPGDVHKTQGSLGSRGATGHAGPRAGVRIEPRRNSKARLTLIRLSIPPRLELGRAVRGDPWRSPTWRSASAIESIFGCESPWSPRTFASPRFVISVGHSREARFSVPRCLCVS